MARARITKVGGREIRLQPAGSGWSVEVRAANGQFQFLGETTGTQVDAVKMARGKL